MSFKEPPPLMEMESTEGGNLMPNPSNSILKYKGSSTPQSTTHLLNSPSWRSFDLVLLHNLMQTNWPLEHIPFFFIFYILVPFIFVDGL